MYLEVGFWPQGGVCPGGGEGAVHILQGVEVQAQGGEVCAQRQGGQIRVRHADDAEQPQKPEAVG